MRKCHAEPANPCGTIAMEASMRFLNAPLLAMLMLPKPADTVMRDWRLSKVWPPKDLRENR